MVLSGLGLRALRSKGARMPRPEKLRTDLAPPDQTATADTKAAGPSPAVLTHEQINRWASLVANGEAVFPDNLPEAAKAALCQEVRRRRRDRLIRFVACAIARELWRELQTNKEKTDAQAIFQPTPCLPSGPLCPDE